MKSIETSSKNAQPVSINENNITFKLNIRPIAEAYKL